MSESFIFDISIVKDYYPHLLKYAEFEELIYNISEDNFQELLERGQKFKEEEWELLHIYIAVSAQKQPFSFKISADLWSKFERVDYEIGWGYEFLEYLVCRGLLSPDQIHQFDCYNTTETYENRYKNITAAELILKDDIDGLVFESSKPNFFKTHLTILGDHVTPLEFSAFCGASNCFKYLFINAVDKSRIAEFAVKGGSLDIIDICNQNGVDFSHSIGWSVKWHKTHITQWLIDNYGIGDLILSHCISSLNTIAIVFGLLHGFDIELPDISHHEVPIIHCGCTGFYHVMKIIVEKGVKLNPQESLGYTAINYACFNGHVNIVQYLYEKGCDIEIPNIEGDTPLFTAVKMNHYNCVKFLIEHGANVNIVDFHHHSPLTIALLRKHFDSFKLLLESGADHKQITTNPSLMKIIRIHAVFKPFYDELAKYTSFSQTKLVNRE